MPATPNAKLEGRAIKTVVDIAGCDPEQATDALLAGGSKTKQAVLIARGASAEDADKMLDLSQNNLRTAMLAQDKLHPRGKSR